MIFVTIGSAVKGAEFTRLIKKMDEIAGKIEEEVVMQIGSVEYKPQHAVFFRYVSYSEALSYFRKASLIVGHGGTGTIMNAFRFQVPIIVVPRRFQYGELDRDDHQLEIAQRLEKEGLIEVIYEMEDLESAVKNILGRNKKVEKRKPSPEKEKLIQTIKDFVDRCT